MYLQISGTAMGTTVAPIYANLTMAYLEIQLYAKCKELHINTFDHIFNNFKRYLDDCFIILDINIISKREPTSSN